jgi:twitching motility protein PilU
MEHIDYWLDEMMTRGASDLYITYGSKSGLRVEDTIVSLGTKLTDTDIQRYLDQLLSAAQREEYSIMSELNMAFLWKGKARFRVNVFRQQGHDGIVIRRVQMTIPKLEDLLLPKLYGDLALLKRGLILIAGPTGSGKTTSLAAMVGHRNNHGTGHIITVEDPIEFTHQHQQCIITQRDVGLDTNSYATALKNALRQRPDMVVIGEIRDREVMEQAIYFAETGHLCLATIHANNSSQAIERVLNFFPEERHRQILMNLALNLRAVLSQRLVANTKNSRTLVIEIMLNNGLIRQLIEEGKIRQIREMIEKGASEGMQTFDQCLLELYNKHIVSEDTVLAESDNPSNLRMQLTNLKGVAKMISEDMLIRQGGHHHTVNRDALDF